MARFVDLSIPAGGWSSELAYFVCTIHRAIQFTINRADCDPYKAVCESYDASVVSNFDPLVPTVKIVTYSRGTGPNDRWTIMSIRGTETLASWSSNITGYPPRTDTRIRGKCHGYFLDAAQRLWLQLETTFRNTVGNGRCLFTGHSLGGAIALAMSWFLKNSKPNGVGSIVTLGAPRLGDPVFANPVELQPAAIMRLENADDGFCNLPPTNIIYPVDSGWGPLFPGFAEFRHAGAGYTISSTEGVRPQASWNAEPLARTLINRGHRTLFDRAVPHSNFEYTRRLRNTMLLQPMDDSTISVPWLDEVNANISHINGESAEPFE